MGKKGYNAFEKLLAACIKHDRLAQRELYVQYYNYAMSICIRYAKSREEAAEIMNDGFMKIFKYLSSYDPKQAFNPWLRRIMINCSIDHLRKSNLEQELRSTQELESTLAEDEQYKQLQYEELLTIIQKLSPAYRTVFNLYAIEGYKHEEIAEQLNISVGTSKSNYHKAKAKLQEYLKIYFEVNE